MYMCYFIKLCVIATKILVIEKITKNKLCIVGN